MRALPLYLLLVTLTSACGLSGTAETALAEPAITVTTSTPTASATITATPTIAPTHTPAPPHPLTIEYLRGQAYPASEVVVEQRLEDGDNYFRYYASYYSEGLKQYGLLTVPFGEKPATGWPVIIFNHGYIAPESYRTTERYVNYVDGFARSGYIVFRPDYRGHDQSEGQASGAYRGPDYVIDVLNAVAALKAYPEADRQRIGMWGHSMGGYITLRAMVVDTDIKAGVIWAGVVGSYAEMYSLDDRPRYGSRSLAAAYGTPAANQEFWDSISATSYLEDLSGPLQLHHGTADQSVLPDFSLSLAEAAREAGQVAELYFYDGDDHNISRYFTSAMLRSIEFFDMYVKGA